MSNPLVHAERSAKKWGGLPQDYLAIHQWFDATKAHLPDNRHRMILHNSFGMLVAEQVFGPAVALAGNRRVFVRDVAVQHIVEDVGFVPTLAQCLEGLPLAPWIAGGRRAFLPGTRDGPQLLLTMDRRLRQIAARFNGLPILPSSDRSLPSLQAVQSFDRARGLP